MRVRESGFGFFGFGAGGQSRSNSFKKGRRKGQKVRGTLLKWVSDDMAWVEIEGHKLLAQLASKPPVGAQLTFIIKQLVPDIILKEVFSVSSAGADALSMAKDFDTARTLFENALRKHVQPMDMLPHTERLKGFLDLLAGDKRLLSAFLDTAACIQTFNHHLDTEKIGTLIYQPWPVPTGRRHLALLRGGSDTQEKQLTEAITEFELGEFGMIRCEFLHRPSETGYRLKLQHPARANELKRYLNSRKHPELAGSLQCLGISKLPQSSHGGILAELMFSRKS